MKISKDLKGRLLDLNVFRGAAGGMSDHYLVVGRIRVNGDSVMREIRNILEMVNV